MKPVRATLYTDGRCDRVLVNLLRWSLQRLSCPIASLEWADLSVVRTRSRGLAERLRMSVELYPCNLLLVHRDAERETIESRQREIRKASEGLSVDYLCIVPVRMIEAWLLFSEAAIRRAAGNPSGLEVLALPTLRDVEGEPDPKQVLHTALKQASGLSGRRRAAFNVGRAVHDVAANIGDFSPLRELPAFREVERQLGEFVAAWAKA